MVGVAIGARGEEFALAIPEAEHSSLFEQEREALEARGEEFALTPRGAHVPRDPSPGGRGIDFGTDLLAQSQPLSALGEGHATLASTAGGEGKYSPCFIAVLTALALALLAGCKASRTETSPDAEVSVPPAPPAPVAPAEDAAVAPPAFGPPRHVEKALCTAIGRPGGMFAQFVARRDLTTSFVDGDDLLALVNRSPVGTLAPDYAPSDMVELLSGNARTARECETRGGACLRREAADALKAMLAEMRQRGFFGRIESAYRSYASQCGVFVDWTKKDEEATFCGVSEQSALAGHSQHQLGTTVDLFTEDWFREGEKEKLGSFRNGFGCTHAGRWLDENSWRFGFVIPYPIHPDDRHETQKCVARWDIHVPPNPRTGYRHEPWHLRFIGRADAARFREEVDASGRGTPAELTLEQWLRRRLALDGDADLPVCDGCSCGACATLAPNDEKPTPCGDASLWLDERGRPVDGATEPRIVDARLGAAQKDPPGQIVEVKIASAPHTLTQPPVAPSYAEGASFEALAPYKRTAPRGFAELPRAWRLAIEPAGGAARWPWRASLAKDTLARTFNRANLYLPARAGEAWIRVVIPPTSSTLRVTLLRDGEEHGTRELVHAGK